MALAAALPASAQLLSNGTGGDFATGSTWALGAAPATSAFKIVTGDVVTAGSGLAYSASNRNNDVAGALTINPGASILMGRHNATLLPSETGSLTHIAGGILSVSRLTGVTNTNAAINVSSGSLIVRENIAVAATNYSIWLSGGLIDSSSSNYACPLFVSGGTLLMRNGVCSLGGLASGLWNGGRIVVNTSTPSAPATNSLINAWKSNASNLLALSGTTIPQTLTLASSVSSIQGELAFSVYSATAHDNDVFALPNAAHDLTLGAGVILRIEGANLAGTPSSYVGSAYKLFSVASGSYAGITPTIAPVTWTINGDTYVVTFTNTLTSNGTLTVASVHPVDPVSVAESSTSIRSTATTPTPPTTLPAQLPSAPTLRRP